MQFHCNIYCRLTSSRSSLLYVIWILIRKELFKYDSRFYPKLPNSDSKISIISCTCYPVPIFKMVLFVCLFLIRIILNLLSKYLKYCYEVLCFGDGDLLFFWLVVGIFLAYCALF